MNYVFVSPHFPHNFKYFVAALRNEGVNVLGIGSDPYDQLDLELRNTLTEYFQVVDMNDYTQQLKACGYFTFKHGKIDFIESHNEYWLENDARLRTDFNVPGYKAVDMAPIKKKSEMKKVFERAGVPVARGIVIDDLAALERFIAETGYPVCVKPNIGVGAADTYKLTCEEDLEEFLAFKPQVEYLVETYITGEIHSFDGLVDQRGNLIFTNSFIFRDGVLETVSHELNQFYYNQRVIPADLLETGLKVLNAFDVRGRFFHFEFFRTGDNKLIALEVNIRPPGGQSLDMFNYANDIDVYALYAQMIAGREVAKIPETKYYCGYVGVK